MLERRVATRSRELLASRWGATDRLLGTSCFLHPRQREASFFLDALQEAFAYRYLHDAPWAALCRESGFLPHELRSLDEAWRIPEGSAVEPTDDRTRRRLGLAMQRTFEDLGFGSRRHTDMVMIGPPLAPWLERGLSACSPRGRRLIVESTDEALTAISGGNAVRIVTDRPAELIDRLPRMQHVDLLARGSEAIGEVKGWVRAVSLAEIGPLTLACCPSGRFHLPRLARLVSDPEGGLSLVSPAPRSGPSLRTSLPSLWTALSPCPCGRGSQCLGRGKLPSASGV